MTFTKNKKMFLATVGIVTAVFNVVVLVMPFTKGGGFWTGYGFTMLAILLTAAVCLYAFDREGLKSKFYGLPLISVVWRYLLVQLAVGILEMVLFQFTPVPFQYGIAVNTIILGVCLLGLIVVDASKEEIERIDEKVKEKLFYIKSLQVDVESLAGKIPDESLKKALKALAETIRYSDPMSNSQLAAIENKIEAKVTDLTEAVEKANSEAIKTLCNDLQQLFAERNRKCKILK
ncbi:hypothetical protein AGMMS49546_14000 [Spirochaetia bacterium]|nr:hypothetical protein AGMMS49546_14000 [Spirochaetia bacterium]